MKHFIISACTFALSAAFVLPASAQTCPEPNKAAGVAEVPTVNFPTVEHSPAHGTVVIRVKLSDKGDLVGYDFVESTGNKSLDMTALKAARSVKYTPELIDCKAVPGTYLFVVVFPQQP